MKQEPRMRRLFSKASLALFFVGALTAAPLFRGEKNGANPKFEISFPRSVSTAPLTGRMFLVIARTDTIEPRLQVGRYGVQLFGVDFARLWAGSTVTIDGATLG
ncbi:MAG: hypothetical protein AABZ02_12040 [Bacteroidota bacterium]